MAEPAPTKSNAMMRQGRRPDELRAVRIELDFLRFAPSSVFYRQGGTEVICAATVQDGVPAWLRGQKKGWISAEYGMLPSATGERTPREATRGKQSGRTVEIQRLIGRSLRAVCDLERLGERTVTLDCDVINADGGTRCASISGAYVALERALRALVDRRTLKEVPLTDSVAAVSVGICRQFPLLDLEYAEDCIADVDMNVVMTGRGKLIEVQATAEGTPFSRENFDELLDLAQKGIREINQVQLGAALPPRN